MTKSQKIISIILGAIAIAGVVATVLLLIHINQPEEPPITEEPKLDCPMVDGVVTYSGEAGKSALDLLTSICELETSGNEETGLTVTSIDELPTTAPDYWAFYVNDRYALTTPDKYQTLETDTIKWQLESLGN